MQLDVTDVQRIRSGDRRGRRLRIDAGPPSEELPATDRDTDSSTRADVGRRTNGVVVRAAGRRPEENRLDRAEAGADLVGEVTRGLNASSISRAIGSPLPLAPYDTEIWTGKSLLRAVDNRSMFHKRRSRWISPARVPASSLRPRSAVSR
jgi:hypothetical protein